MTRRRRPVMDIINHRIEMDGRNYRVAVHDTHILIVALKCSKGGERILDPLGRKAQKIIAKVKI